METICIIQSVVSFERKEQLVDLGQVSTLTLGIYGSFFEGARTFDYYPYEN